MELTIKLSTFVPNYFGLELGNDGKVFIERQWESVDVTPYLIISRLFLAWRSSDSDVICSLATYKSPFGATSASAEVDAQKYGQPR